MDGSAVLDRADLDTDSPVPLHHQLSSAIAQRVRTGLLPSGARLPAVVDLCQSLNLSITTVNRSLQDLKRQGYVTTRRGHGTFVAPMAAPATEVILALGYEARGAIDSFFGPIMDGLREADLRTNRRHVLTQFPDYFPDARELLELCRVRHSDSVVVYRPPPDAAPVLAAVARQKAVVTLLRRFADAPYDSVLSDPEPALAEWMRQRHAEGCRRFVYVGKAALLQQASPYQEALTAFEHAAEGLGAIRSIHLLPGDPSVHVERPQIAVQDSTAAALAGGIGDGDVVVAQTPHIASYLRCRAPTVRMISYTESEHTVQTFTAQMTLLYLSVARVGEAAGRLLRARLDAPEIPPQCVRLVPQTVDRVA